MYDYVDSCPNTSRIIKLEKEIHDLKEETKRKDDRNMLCNYISKVYVLIVDHVNNEKKINCISCKHPPNCNNTHCRPSLSGDGLMIKARTDPDIHEHIKSAYRALGFEDEEWQALRSFKSFRNFDEHPNKNMDEAHYVIKNRFSDRSFSSLQRALYKTIDLCE